MSTPLPDRFNLAAHVMAKAAQAPDKIALAVLSPVKAQRWSFAALEDRVLRMAAGLLAEGLAPGDRVLLRLGNTADFPVAFLAAIAVGLVPVPTSAQLTVPEVSRLAGEIAPRLILAQDGIALPDPLPCPVVTDLGALTAREPADWRMGSPEDLAYIVTTSGTSGRPRLVAHAHRAILARRMMHDGWYGLRESDRLLHAGAFNWTFTLGTGLLDPWSVGATALIPAVGSDATALPLLLRRHDATIFAAAPGVYRQMLRAGLPQLPKLRHGLSAGEKLPDPVREDWQAATGTTIHEALGMSECSTFISGSPDRPAPQGTLGFAQPGRRIAILDAEGAPVAPGETGTLAVHRGDPGLMLGYLAQDGVDLPLSSDWFVTGDMVHARPDGALVYHGRADDMLNAGGFRVSPLEIEAAFASLLGDCAAVSVEIRDGVHIICLAHCSDADEDALRRHAETCLARYKQPRRYQRLDALPRGANGKLNRRALAKALKETP
ncbi:long-chain fatty acid--CoA ligase [Rhodobacteraceae bacterium W635]|uniref:class I adenylate-forming enzyme family protein n=1 Tax=Nioella halotolerans TaxID=2303578 RepID=UPI000E3BEE89|nr:long-chain fatty acid--CoA ligase [Rhodobacteraceae bacterium W635]